MKNQWSTLKLSITMITTASLIAAVSATAIKGFNQEGLRLFEIIFRKMAAVGFWVSVILLIVFLWQWKKSNKLIKQSRTQCRETYQELFDYLQANCLKGFDDPKCRELHRALERELNWHCEQYPPETENLEVAKFRAYCHKTRLLGALDD